MFQTFLGFFVSLHLVSNVAGQTAKDIGQLFSVNHVVPDLLPAFNPTTLFQVTYAAPVIPGEILSQNSISTPFPGLTLFRSNVTTTNVRGSIVRTSPQHKIFYLNGPSIPYNFTHIW